MMEKRRGEERERGRARLLYPRPTDNRQAAPPSDPSIVLTRAHRIASHRIAPQEGRQGSKSAARTLCTQLVAGGDEKQEQEAAQEAALEAAPARSTVHLASSYFFFSGSSPAWLVG